MSSRIKFHQANKLQKKKDKRRGRPERRKQKRLVLNTFVSPTLTTWISMHVQLAASRMADTRKRIEELANCASLTFSNIVAESCTCKVHSMWVKLQIRWASKFSWVGGVTRKIIAVRKTTNSYISQPCNCFISLMTVFFTLSKDTWCTW